MGEIEYMEVFQQIDSNHDGEIDQYEFIKACVFENGTEISNIIKLIDKVPLSFWNGEQGDEMHGK